MSLRRIGPSPGGVPSLEASNQAQIEDLVQRNRTLEHKNTKLTEQLAQEAARGKDALADIQRQWEQNQRQWRAGCEDVLASYRIVQKQVEVELERERGAVIKEMTITREEKLQRLQRDYKITLFQMKEEALERRIEEIEEQSRREAEEAEDALRLESQRAASIATKLKATKEALARSLRDKEEKEAKYNKLVAEYSNMEASCGTLDTKYQRTQLKLEGAQNKMSDLERLNDELRRANTDLTNQLERWENLETKGGEAKEKEHKKRIALELELNELKAEYDAQAEELEKAKKKTEKMKDVAANYESEVKEQKGLVADTKRQLAKLTKQAEKLKADLEAERARVRPPSPQKARESSSAAQEEIHAEEIIDDSPPPEPKASKAKPSSRSASKAGPSTASTSKPPFQIARKTTGRKPPKPLEPTVPEDSDVEEISEPEEEAAPAPSRKGKGKAKAVEVDNDAGEEVAEAPALRKRGKRKADEDENASGQDEVLILEPKVAAKKAPAARKAPSKSRGGSRAPSKQPAVEVVEVEEEPKKKKRKMIFPSANAPGPFEFRSLQKFDDNGLNIPSILSPVKLDEPVPQRSGNLSVMKLLGRK